MSARIPFILRAIEQFKLLELEIAAGFIANSAAWFGRNSGTVKPNTLSLSFGRRVLAVYIRFGFGQFVGAD